MILSSVLFILYFVMVAVPGFVIVRSLVRKETDLLVLLPISMFVGLSIFLFGLNWVLYLVPFAWANKLWLVVYFAACIGIGFKGQLLTLQDCRWTLGPLEKRAFLIATTFVALMFTALTAGTFYTDNIYHSTQAISIQHGNIHPLKWPWYPEYHYAYHYAYALMKASVQDFCGINQFYSDKPWYVLFLVGLFSFIVGFVTRSLNGNFKIGLGAGICFLFFCGFSTIPMVAAVARLAMDALHQPAKTTYDALIELYKSPPYADISFFPHSIHKPMLIRFPVYVSLVFLFVQGPRRSRSDLPFVLINSSLLGFLCLCDESLFGLTGLGLGIYVLVKAYGVESGHKIQFLVQAMAVLVLGGLWGIMEGGFLTTTVFHHSEQFAPGSAFAETGGYGQLSLRDGFRFLSRPVLTLDMDTWMFFGSYYVLPMICFVALQLRTWRTRRILASEWIESYLIWCITFWIGVLFAGMFTMVPSDVVLAARMYLWPIMCLSTGIYLMLWLEARFGWRKFGVWLAALTLAFCIMGTMLRIGSGCAVSAAFYFSNERKEIQRNLKFGGWLRHTLPNDAVTFGFDARYTGLFSFGGNPFLDGASIPKSELDAFEKSKVTVAHDFLIRNRITHLVVNKEQFGMNRDALLNTNRFVEIPAPFSTSWRVFLVRDERSPALDASSKQP